MRRFILIRTMLFALALASPCLMAQDVRLTASVDSSSVRVGDWIRMRVTAESPASVESMSPLVEDSLGSFEVLRVQSAGARTEQNERTQVWNLRITSFEPGELVIPPIRFSYTLSGDSTPRFASTSSIPISIRGVEIDPKGDIKDIKRPIVPPWALEDFIPYGIALGLLLAAGLAYYFYRRSRKAEVVEFRAPHLPPHEQALLALRALEEKRLWQQGKAKEYYTEVTDIIRRFFEGRFRIVALEMTSDEIMQQLKGIPDAADQWKLIGTLFLTADLVKFAKYVASTEEHENELRWAYAIVRSMIPKQPDPVEGHEEVTSDVR